MINEHTTADTDLKLVIGTNHGPEATYSLPARFALHWWQLVCKRQFQRVHRNRVIRSEEYITRFMRKLTLNSKHLQGGKARISMRYITVPAYRHPLINQHAL